MNDPNNYLQSILTFNNPFFFALILSVVLICTVVFIYIKLIYPLQKKLVNENQRYLTEKAELMALFAEMDPDPLIRIDADWKIIQTNEESRKIFADIEKKGATICDIIPSFEDHIKKDEDDFIESINEKIYSIKVKRKPGLAFQNIYMHNITALKNHEFLQEVNRRRLKLLSEKLDSEIEDLKNSLAIELHDDLGQRLIMTKLKISDPSNISLEEINSDVDFIYNRIRSISRSLKPSDIGNLGLRLSLSNLIETISKNSEIEGIFDFYGSEEGIELSLLTCIFRVIQEATNNIVKHSGASEFSVQVSIRDEIISVIIIDNGCGIPSDYFEIKESKVFGTGLFGMKERIEKYKGTLRIESNSKIGTNLFIEIPRC